MPTTQRLSAGDWTRNEVYNFFKHSIKGGVEISVTLVSRGYSLSFPARVLPFILPWLASQVDWQSAPERLHSGNERHNFWIWSGQLCPPKYCQFNGVFVREMPSPWVVSFFFFCFCIFLVVWPTRPSKALEVFTSRMKLTAADKFVFELVSMKPCFAASLIHRTNFCTLSPECAMLFVVPAFLQLGAQIFFFRRQAVRERVDLSI